ncbi:ABC transporter ATP-binding protein [Patescibacteria group bacterium]|nr:ABC transporter ATP-binding protein [Patescibacteria group bacterium]MCH7756638.1 ABC transporter ATP-binding protein [Patescibacteria group bacterium]
MLEIKNLTKTFDELKAVDDVSVTIKKGEIFSLIGPNGSGKTTIIKVIAGLLQPTGGEVVVYGSNISEDPIKSKSQIGYIPDEPTVWSSMTGEEFLHFTGALFGISNEARAKKISELLSLFKLEGIEKNYFENYSRGNKQKFTIIAALLHSPKILLIDEPIVGLDPHSAEIAKNTFREFANDGGLILMATHTLTVAEEISDRIGVLKQGVLIESGTFEYLKGVSKLEGGATLEQVYNALVV